MALAGLAVVVAVGAVVLWPRADWITRENCDRIHEGTTLEEAAAILGPPGDYRTRITSSGANPWVSTYRAYWTDGSSTRQSYLRPMGRRYGRVQSGI